MKTSHYHYPVRLSEEQRRWLETMLHSTRTSAKHYVVARVLVNWLNVGTQILGRGSLVRTFSQKTMGRRFDPISSSWLTLYRTHHLSSKRCTTDFGFLP